MKTLLKILHCLIVILLLIGCKERTKEAVKDELLKNEKIQSKTASNAVKYNIKAATRVLDALLESKQSYTPREFNSILVRYINDETKPCHLRMRAFESLTLQEQDKYIFNLLISCHKLGVDLNDIMGLVNRLPYDSKVSHQAIQALYMILKESYSHEDLLAFAAQFETGDLAEFLGKYAEEKDHDIRTYEDVLRVIEKFDSATINDEVLSKMIEAAGVTPSYSDFETITSSYALTDIALSNMTARMVESNSISTQDVVGIAKNSSIPDYCASSLIGKFYVKDDNFLYFINHVINDEGVDLGRRRFLLTAITRQRGFHDSSQSQRDALGDAMTNNQIKEEYFQVLDMMKK